MTDKLEALKAAALAATPGPWECRDGDFDYSIRQAGSTIKYSGCEEYTPIAGEVTGAETAAFIAATSPDVVLSLLAALEEKDQRIAELNVKLFDQSILLDAAISRAEASGRREEHLKASVDVLSAKNAELEQQQEATQQGVQILTEAIGAHGYIVGCLERNRPDLALEESLKWMSVFSQAAAKVEGE